MSKQIQDLPLDLSAEIKPLIHKLGTVLGKEGAGSILTFAAARSGEGTTTVARAFARALNAETGKKILVIEGGADEKSMGNGIVELVSSGADISSGLTPLGSGIFTGKWVTSAQGKTMSTRVIADKAFWQSLQHGFDVVIIDAPSLQESLNAIAFAQASDLTILVVEAEATRKEVVENLRDTFMAANVKIGGVIINKRRLYIPEKIYKRL